MTDRIRRDPHAERDARRRKVPAETPAPAAPTAPTATPSSGRVRRDPHAERLARRQGQAVAPTPAMSAPAPSVPVAPALAVKRIESPAFLVAVVPDLDDARLSSHDRDAFGAARLLADAGGGGVVAIAFTGPEGAKDDLGEAGADRVAAFADAAFAAYAPEARAAAVLAVIERLGVRHTVFPDTAVMGGDVGRRVAARLKQRAATAVVRVAADEVVRRAAGGREDVALAPPPVILIAAEAADHVVDARHEARPVDATTGAASLARVADKGLVATDPQKVPLAEADFIVSAGNGIADWDGFHRLAAALGASEGGSRPVCDAGHLPRYRQVGASGTLVEPRCYVALGIAGAPQHLQGIAKAERVVSINPDPHCDMVKRADLAVVGDAQAIMPALERVARERRRV